MFACDEDADCLAGAQCVNGVCQPAGYVSEPDVDIDDADAVIPSGEDAGPMGAVITSSDAGAPDIEQDAGGPCDPIRQTGCAADENCTFFGELDAPECAPSGPSGEGEPCSADVSCAQGLCAQLSADLPWVCFAFCGTDSDCDEVTCLDVGQSFGLCQIPGLYAPCDLLTGEPCVGGQGCYLATGEDEPVCLPAGTATVAQGCDNANDCNVGLACVFGTCRQLCEMGEDGCADGESCTTYLDDAGWCELDEP